MVDTVTGTVAVIVRVKEEVTVGPERVMVIGVQLETWIMELVVVVGRWVVEV